MPSISTCPKCAQPVAVPDGLEESTAVRCPLCDAQYRAEEVTELTIDADHADDLPAEVIPVEPSPETESDSTKKESGPLVRCPCCEEEFELAAVIVAATGEELGSHVAAMIGADGSVASADDGSDGSTYSIAIDTGIETAAAAPGAFDFHDDDADHRDAALVGAAAAGVTRRRRDGEKHPFRLMVEIVLGGVAGLAITYYGLNFFGGQRFAYFDIYLPGVAHTVEHRPSWWPAMAERADSDQTDTDLPGTPFEMPTEPDVARADGFGSEMEPLDEDPAQRPTEPPMPAEEPAEDPGEEPEEEPEKEPEKQPPPEVGPADAPSFTSDELGQVLKTTHDVVTTDGLTDDDYRRLCELAQAVTFVETADGGPKLRNRLEAVDTMLRKIGRQEPNLVKIGENAAAVAFDQDRTGNGILLAGTLESNLKLGRAHGASVQLSGTDSPLVVVSTKPMPAELGDRVLVLGSIVDKPAESMIGVETSMRRVIWSRMTVNLDE